MEVVDSLCSGSIPSKYVGLEGYITIPYRDFNKEVSEKGAPWEVRKRVSISGYDC